MYPSDPVTIVEVGPRDGLQYEPEFFATADKLKLIGLLEAAGLKRMEVTSFVHPKAIPQFKDTMEVIGALEPQAGLIRSALVPNVKGAMRAVETGVDELALFVSASEIHNRKNVNMSVADSLAALTEVARMGLTAGKRLRGYVVTAFGCPYEGRIEPERVLAIIAAYKQMGVAEISLGDTTGMANPRQVGQLFELVLPAAGQMGVAAHFHDSRGTGLANALAAYGAGVRVFDASVGGIGGCPTALGAMGNIATEDLVNMMEEMGLATGVDLEALLQAAAFAQQTIGTELPSRILKAGPPNWAGQPPEEPGCAT